MIEPPTLYDSLEFSRHLKHVTDRAVSREWRALLANLERASRVECLTVESCDGGKQSVDFGGGLVQNPFLMSTA